MQKDFAVNISATAEAMPAHRSLPVLGPMFLGVCDFRQTSELLPFHAPFMGEVLAVGQVSLAGGLAAKAPGSNFCDFNRL